MDKKFFSTAKPKSSILSQYISYYYFDSDLREQKINKIVYYPNIVNALTIYKNSVLEFTENNSIAKRNEDISYSHYYGGILENFRGAQMNTPYEKIGIAFKPYGINVFLDLPLSELLVNPYNLRFTYFESMMKTTLDAVYEATTIDEKVAILERFFLSKIKTEQDIVLKEAMKIIEQTENKIKVSELATQLNINARTLNRKFNKHLNCSAKSYINIVQFRKSFNYYLKTDKTERLTDLAYKFDYYDQSDFINKFKKITNLNPKLLFNTVKKHGQEDLFWKK